MVGSVVGNCQRHGGAVGVFDAGGDGLWGDDMSDKMSEESWAQAWETYRWAREKTAERDAFRAGYETGRMRNWFTRALVVEGSIGWAVQRMNEGKAVKRRNWQGFITKEDTIVLSSVDLFATDWELYWPESETPDSPCDVP